MSYVPNKPSSDGFYLHFPIGFKRDDVTPAAGCWYKTKAAAISEMVRLANLTNKSFAVVRVVSKCVPWHDPNQLKAPKGAQE